MARFRGMVQGNRGGAARLGHKSLTTLCNGWSSGVRVDAVPFGEEDHFEIRATGGSNGGDSFAIGTVRRNPNTRILEFVPIDKGRG